MKIDIKGKSLWIVQITNPEKEPDWKDKSVIHDVWRNRGIGIMAEKLEGALSTTRENFPNCKILSINKHTNQIYIEGFYDAEKVQSSKELASSVDS